MCSDRPVFKAHLLFGKFDLEQVSLIPQDLVFTSAENNEYLLTLWGLNDIVYIVIIMRWWWRLLAWDTRCLEVPGILYTLSLSFAITLWNVYFNSQCIYGEMKAKELICPALDQMTSWSLAVVGIWTCIVLAARPIHVLCSVVIKHSLKTMDSFKGSWATISSEIIYRLT